MVRGKGLLAIAHRLQDPQDPQPGSPAQCPAKAEVMSAIAALRWALAVLVAAALIAGTAEAQGHYGKVGGTVKLTVGYQPYYTQSWSGVVMRGKRFYEKYLPVGSQVEFQIGLQGAIIVDNMVAGKQAIGYMGDMPAIVSTTKTADIRLVANLGLAFDQCNIVLVRSDAPQFGSPKDALKWLDGKKVAVPKGSCADRFAQAT